MENLSEQIINSLSQINNAKYRSNVENFVRVFFNRRKSKNTALLLGVTDERFIKEFLGNQCGELIKDDAEHLIHLKKVIRKDQEEVRFAFVNRDEEPPFEIKGILKSLYSNDMGESLDNAFKSGEYPTLVLKRPINDFLSDIPKGIVKLIGERWFKSITISSSYKNECNTSLHSSIDDMYIIPKSYKPLCVDSAEIADENCKSDKHGFWDKFNADVIDSFKFNFVILNNVDDHLQRIFIGLMNLYRNHFSIAPENNNILKRIFFVCDKSYTKKTRCFENYSDELKNEVQNLRTDISELESDYRDAELYACMLDRMSKDNGLSELTRISDFAKEFIRMQENNKIGRQKLQKDIDEFIDCYVKDYQEVSNEVSELRKLIVAKETREKICDKIDHDFHILLDFAEKYKSQSLKSVVEKRESFTSKKEDFLKRRKNKITGGEKFLLWNTRRVENKDDFKKFVMDCINEIKSWWSDSQKWSKIPLWDDVQKEIEKEKHGLSSVSSMVDKFSACENFIYHFDSHMHKVKVNIDDLYVKLDAFEQFDSKPILDGSFKQSFDNIITKAIESDNSNIPELGKLSNYIIEYKSREAIKQMLLDNLKEILNK